MNDHRYTATAIALHWLITLERDSNSAYQVGTVLMQTSLLKLHRFFIASKPW